MFSITHHNFKSEHIIRFYKNWIQNITTSISTCSYSKASSTSISSSCSWSNSSARLKSCPRSAGAISRSSTRYYASTSSSYCSISRYIYTWYTEPKWFCSLKLWLVFLLSYISILIGAFFFFYTILYKRNGKFGSVVYTQQSLMVKDVFIVLDSKQNLWNSWVNIQG